MNAIYVTLVVLAVAAVAAALTPLVRAWLRSRGERLVMCPDNHSPAVVALDAVDAAFNSVLGTHELHLKSCTRWPAKAGCAQTCLAQIESTSNGCRVNTLLADWYRGQSCAICGKPFGEIKAWDHRPALMTPDRVTLEWPEIDPAELPQKAATHHPVCWDCHIVETLYRLHPEVITERPPHWAHYH